MLRFTIQGIVSPTSPGLTDRTRLGGYKRKQATDGNGYVSNQTGIATIARLMSGCVKASIGDDSVRNISREQTELVLAEVRQREMARAVGRPIPGVNAFSVPVFDQSGSLALVITSIGPEGTFDADWESTIAVKLRHCAAGVSERLGFPSGQSHAMGSSELQSVQ